jgi:hypothetical protein
MVGRLVQTPFVQPLADMSTAVVGCDSAEGKRNGHARVGRIVADGAAVGRFWLDFEAFFYAAGPFVGRDGREWPVTAGPISSQIGSRV